MAFDLAKVLGGIEDDVPNSGTGHEQIEYIDIDKLDGDPKNFYAMDGIQELAANIEFVGLQQPIRVRINPEDSTRAIIVAGHRRTEAMRLLVSEGKDVFRQVACIRDSAEGSEALKELRLIYANSDTRNLSNSDISKQAERVEALLYQLKEEGVEFPGRMRDHVAEACKISKSKLSRLKVIREGLKHKQLEKAWDKGELNESVAYVLAQQSPYAQKKIYYWLVSVHEKTQWFSERDVSTFAGWMAALEKLICKKCDGKCENTEAMLEKCAANGVYSYQPCVQIGCCDKCSELLKCKYSCSKVSAKKEKLRTDARAAKREEKDAQAEKNRPDIELIREMWQRFGFARERSGKSIKETMTGMGIPYYGNDDKIMALECLEAKVKTDTGLPYGYDQQLSALKPLKAAADFLDCSVDYLLCRTNMVNGAREPRPLKWQAGTPEKPGEYAAIFMDCGVLMKEILYWDGEAWRSIESDPASELNGESVYGWLPLPGDEI